MKGWVEATDITGKKVWLNMSVIRYLVESGHSTHVHFDKDHYVPVTQTPQQLVALAGAA
jgi:hypothetical protein